VKRASRLDRSARPRWLPGDDGAQSIVEFALILPILLFLVMGIIQFGLVFNAYVTLTNAVREAAREGSIHVFRLDQSIAQNDAARHAAAMTAMVGAKGALNMGTATSGTTNFAHGATWSGTGNGPYANGDVTITYIIPSGVTANDARRSYDMVVEAYYHESLFVPLMDVFLPDDPSRGGSWFRVPSRITVKVN
jgi:Flp pilus assembly protein TadG